MGGNPECSLCGAALPTADAPCPACDAPTLERPGFPVIPGYRPLGTLGAGGMGEVFLAEDETLGRRVAVKVVAQRFVQDEQARSRFLREARAMATVEHPHVVRLYAFGEVEGRPYLIMQHIDGETLAARLRNRGHFDPRTALNVIRQCAEALEAAWQRGIVHRDVKPANVLVDAVDRAHVADFGLAKPSAGEGEALTRAAAILGTPEYMAPERARGHESDFRADVYSLGIVLYELLTGERPFSGTTPFAIMEKHVGEELPALPADVPPSTAALLRWMTQKDPDQRPASYAKLLEAIEAVLGGRDHAPTSVTGGPSRRARLGAAALLALLAAIAGWQTRDRPGPADVDASFVVAVTPFYGPDDLSAREGRVMAALVETAVAQKLGRGARVLGIEDTREAVRSHAAARSLGERLGAGLVLWGEAFVIGGETELRPQLTLVAPVLPAGPVQARRTLGDSLEALAERPMERLTVGAQMSNQIELRRTSAEGLGDAVLVIAGLHALHVRKDFQQALSLFEQAPSSGETLRLQAQARMALGQREEALTAARRAVAVDPGDAGSQALVGDLEMEAGRPRAALQAYARALPGRDGLVTGVGFGTVDRIYVREMRTGRLDDLTNAADQTGFLLGIDRVSSSVVERYVLPGPVGTFARTAAGIEIAYLTPWRGSEARFMFVEGAVVGSPGLPPSLHLRRQLEFSSRALLPAFAAALDQGGIAPDLATRAEAAFRDAAAADPTQPWHAFHLGAALAALGRPEEASRVWDSLLSSETGLPYYVFAHLAARFEQLGEPTRADLAFARALEQREALPQPVEWATLIECLVNAPFVRSAAEAALAHPADPRARVWLERGRALVGVIGEGDGFAAAAWTRHFEGEGRTDLAARETAWLHLARQGAPFRDGRWVALERRAYALHATALAFLVAVGAFLVQGGLGLRDRLAAVQPARRRLLAIAGSVTVVCGVAHNLAVSELVGVTNIPIGLADSPQSVGPELEAWLEERGTTAARYATAVAHHLGARFERAIELYRALLDDPRAGANMTAALDGRPPARSLTASDVVDAYTSGGTLAHLVNAARIESQWFDDWMSDRFAAALLKSAKGLTFAIPVVLAVLAIGLWRVRAAAADPPPRGRVDRGLDLLLPGWHDLRSDAPWRGYMGALLFGFAMVALAASARSLPAQGPFSALANTGIGAFPFPAPGPMASREALAAHHFWTLFWSYPDAVLFWTAVAASGIVGIALHLAAVRRILRKPAP